MSKKYDAGWENALTVVQEAQPPFIPEGAHAMTVVIDYPPGSTGAPPHRHPSGPAFGYMLEGEMLFELEGEAPRVIRAGEAFWEPAATSSTTRTATTVTTCGAASPSRCFAFQTSRCSSWSTTTNLPHARTCVCLPRQSPPKSFEKDAVPMAKILLQTTIPAAPDDWDITRFSLLADELRAAGHEVTARNRANRGDDDPILSRLDELRHDQLWLMAVDVGDGLTEADTGAILRFRENGGGVLTARDHENLGSCLCGLGSVGLVNQFHDKNVDPSAMRDDQDTPTISWPNYHSGANGDYQPVLAAEPVHELLRTTRSATGRIEWFPAHPHEGGVSAEGPFAKALAQGRSTVTGRHFNLAVVLDGELAPDGRPMGRALAESTFHHFADYNWDLDCGAPSFVTEPPGIEIKADPSRLAIFKDYVRNIATWLQPATGTRHGDHDERVPAQR